MHQLHEFGMFHLIKQNKSVELGSATVLVTSVKLLRLVSQLSVRLLNRTRFCNSTPTSFYICILQHEATNFLSFQRA